MKLDIDYLKIYQINFLLVNDLIKIGFKAPDHVQGQGVPRIESGAYTPVREHFNLRDNDAIEYKMRF